MELHEEVERHWREVSDHRSRIDELLGLQRARADKVHIAFQQLLQDHREVCAERDELKQTLTTYTSSTSSELSRPLQEEISRLKEDLSQAQEENRALRTLTSGHEEEREHWRKFRQWWDDAINAKKERKSSAKKPKLTDAEKLIISRAGLTSPVPTKLTTHPRAEALSGPAQTAVEQDTASDPVTPITRPAHSLRLTDPTRLRQWLDHVDQHWPTSSTTEGHEAGVTSTQSSSHAPHQKQTSGFAAQTRETTGSNKRRRLAGLSQDDVAAGEPTGSSTRTPLGDLSPNSVGDISHPGGRSLVKMEMDASPQRQPPTSAPKARPRRVTPIKAESDDEGARGFAVARTSQSSPARELTRTELREKRKAEMEDLKRNPWKYRGRGRYAAELSRSDSRAERRQLRPELNGGVAYEHNDVVRDQSTRRRMHAHDCPCCKDYWDLVGPATLNETTDSTSHQRDPRLPFQRKSSLSKRSITDDNAVICIGSDGEDEHRRRRSDLLTTDAISHDQQSFRDRQNQRNRDMAILEEEREQDRLAQERRQRAGRHRAWGKPASTPEGFWEITFPDTPRRDQINDSARKQRDQRKNDMANDPRYRRRD